MVQSLIAGLNDFQPVDVVQTPDNAILLFNGLDAVRRWNGVDTDATLGGVDAPSSAASGAWSGSGSITGDYTFYVRFVRSDGTTSSFGPSGTATASSDATISYTSVPTSSDPDVDTREIYRSTAGQTSVVYLDVTIADNVSTSDSSTNDDTALQANDAVVVSNADASLPAAGFRFGVPPNYKCYAAQYKDRIYAAGEVTYDEGHVEVTNGDATVVGVDTHFTDAMVDRKFTVDGEDVEYQVSSVTSTTELELTTTYSGTTDTLASYAIQPASSERLLVYYTYVGSDGAEPESWPSNYSIEIPAPGGDITGLMPMGPYLYVLKETAIYYITVETDPAVDGGRFPAIETRGCENNRCWCYGTGGAYLLDREGVYFFTGGPPRPVSDQIQNLFRQINWSASKWFSAVYDNEHEVARFFVALGGSYLPNRALCYCTRSRRWWIEDHAIGVGGATQVHINDRLRTVISGQYDQHLVLNEGTRDQDTDDSGGTFRGTVTASTLTSFTDANATFGSDLVGRNVVMVDGTGKTQIRRISAVNTSTRKVDVNPPFLVQPVSISSATPDAPATTYQIGGAKWVWRGRAFRLTQRESETSREYQLTYEPTEYPAHLFLRGYKNREKNPEIWGSQSDEGVVYDEKGVRVTAGDPDIYVDLYRYQEPRPGGDEEDEGYKRYEFSGGATRTGYADRFWTPEMQGSLGQDIIPIYELSIEGVRT